MDALDRLYRKDELIKRSVHVDQDLYKNLQYLSLEVYDASVSKIINVAIEYMLTKKEIQYYKKPKGVDSIYRSVVLRKSLYSRLTSIKEIRGISFSRLINGSIKEFLEDYKDKF